MVSSRASSIVQSTQVDKDADAILSKSLDELTSSDSYTIMFVGTPGEQTYEPEFDDRLRMDLKRDLSSSGNESQRDTRPLFEKYQFFTPGKHCTLALEKLSC